MSEDRETDFLRHCLPYDDSDERHKLQERITKVERDERCIRRAVWWCTLSTLLAIAGICYSAVFRDPRNLSQFTAHLVTRTFCAIGLASVICVLVFWVMVEIYRKQLGRAREECRRLAVKLLESRLGKPSNPSPSLPAVVKLGELIVTDSVAAVVAEIITLPKESRRH